MHYAKKQGTKQRRSLMMFQSISEKYGKKYTPSKIQEYQKTKSLPGIFQSHQGKYQKQFPQKQADSKEQ